MEIIDEMIVWKLVVVMLYTDINFGLCLIAPQVIWSVWLQTKKKT